MNCEQHRAGYLADGSNAPFDRHLSTCSACKRALPGLSTTLSALTDPVLWEEPPVDGFDRLLGTIHASAPQKNSGRRRLWSVAATVVLLAGVATGIAVLRPNDDADWQIALAATAVHPDAFARVAGWNTATGTRIRITVDGIDDLAGDGFYELWMSSPDGENVSAGTFRSAGTIEAWSAVRRADFPRVWITRESFDGDPSPSGDTVVDTPR